MLAVGVNSKTVFQIIAYEAAAIGVLGALSGVTITLAVALIYKLTNPQIAVVIPWWGPLSIIVISILCCTAAGLIPAKQATRVQIIDVLREE